MIESSIDIAQNHCSIEEFAITEITYLKYANDLLNSIKTKQMKMKLSHLSKLGGENKIEDDNFSDINHTHLDCFSLFNMTAKFKLINKLENDIELNIMKITWITLKSLMISLQKKMKYMNSMKNILKR